MFDSLSSSSSPSPSDCASSLSELYLVMSSYSPFHFFEARSRCSSDRDLGEGVDSCKLPC
jgi:hypothetical protein